MDFLSTNQTSLKICGVRTEVDACGLIELGVDAVGFNFWPNSKRYLDPKDAVWLKELEGEILRVGVFVNQAVELSMRLISEGMIDVVQLHGDETPETVAMFSKAGIKVIKALGVKTTADIEIAGQYDADAILLDAHAPVVFGGTGETFDWSLALDFKSRYPNTPMILAGGITPSNAAEAIRQVRPAAIDVASGSESSPGVKRFHQSAAITRSLSSELMITDSHCHLASHRFADQDISSIISRAKSAGVHRMVTLATSLGDIHQNLEIAKTAGISAAIGIHPCDVHHAPDDVMEKLSAHVSDPRVCAIGETGLDYYHPAPDGWSESDFRARQRDLLDRHFQLAASSGLNVVIHTRDREGSQSFEDSLYIYRKYSDRVRSVFHCFISSWDLAEQVIAEGGLVSFGGVTTFKNSHLVKDTVSRCPAGSFMLETDSPYLAPEPMRGKQNEPAYTSTIAEFIAKLRGESLAELAAQTEKAADRFFRWK